MEASACTQAMPAALPATGQGVLSRVVAAGRLAATLWLNGGSGFAGRQPVEKACIVPPAPAEAAGGRPQRMLTPMAWAKQQFGGAQLGDKRRTDRAVVIAERMAMAPGATLPQEMVTMARLKGTYRLLGNKSVEMAALSAPHWKLTREAAAKAGTVLMLQDITALSYTGREGVMDGLGYIGSGNKGRGMLVHSTLAVVPATAEVLGLMHQQMFERVPLPEGTTRHQRPVEERISRVWGEGLKAIGAVPAGARWVVVADREADITSFLCDCRRLRYDFCVRMAENHCLVDENGDADATQDENDRYLLKAARSWEPVAEIDVPVPGHDGNPARTAKVRLSYSPVHLRVPKGEAPLHVWVVRAFEVDAPGWVKEPLEWILATSLPVNSVEDALAALQTYNWRWMIEDYHQCLKTGCGIEGRDFEHVDRLERLLGFVGPLAARLLQLRGTARMNPDMPATAVVDELTVRLLAAELDVSAEGMTVRAFWRNVARLGGFLGRRRDGEPGWRTLWKGWSRLEMLVRGARLGMELGAQPDWC